MLRWLLIRCVVVLTVAVAGPTRPPAAHALQANISVGDILLTNYPLGTVLVEMPVGNPTSVQQTFQFRMLLRRADGSPVTLHVTELIRLRPGVTEWLRFTIPEADGASGVAFDVGLFGTPSDAPTDLRNLTPAALANPR